MDKIPATNRTLVLDLDECLIETFHSYDDETYLKMALKFDPLDRSRFYRFNIYDSDQPRGLGLTETYWGIKRPYLDNFLAFAFRYFKNVIVWSAAKKEYVEQLVKNLFRDHPRPTMIFTRDDVTHVNRANRDYHKPISTILKNVPKIKFEDIVFIDDKADNFRDNPHNGIVIPRFDPQFDAATERDDIRLLQIMQWLMLPEIVAASDFRKTDKSQIFLTPIRNRSIYQYQPDNGYPLQPLI
ncbi:NLI interacting factor phosphatase [uncultured virus]|nr:NLI interacting factor phosphatase [uncultured virus]